MARRLWKNLPEMIIILLCMVILGAGIAKKEGYHMDELLSFELANAEFNPWIVPTQPEGRLAKFVHNEIDGETLAETFGNLADTISDVLQNGADSRLLSYKADVYEEPVWITKEQFTDYITVDTGDDFNYLSVYFNVKDDNHPPLHFMLLHTVSSLFRGSVSTWMGCGINLAAVAVSMLFLMKIGRLLAAELGMTEYGRALGNLTALLYGISAGALASVLLIRMYCVMTCFCVISFYFHLKKWQQGGFAAHNKWLIAVTVLGFWTQYFFLFYCILLAGVTVVLLWCYNRKRELGGYIRSMLCAAVIGVAGFPFSVLHVFSSGRGVEALENLSAGLSGYTERLGSFAAILKDRTWGRESLLLLFLGIVLLAAEGIRRRKEAVQALLMTGQQEKGRKAACLGLLVLPPAGYFLLAARMSPYLVDRYIMAVFPFVMLSGAVIWLGVIRLTEAKSGRRTAWGLCAVLLVLQSIHLADYDGSYLYQGYAKQEELAQSYAHLPCICVYDGVGYYENLLEFTCYDKTLLVKWAELENRQERESIAGLEQAVLLLKEGVDDEEILTLLSEEYHFVQQTELLSGGAYGDRVYLLEKNR